MDPRQKNAVLAASMKKYMREQGVDCSEHPGEYAELALAAMLRTYMLNMDVPEDAERPKGRKSQARDVLLGTDLIIDDPSRTLVSRRILRMDFTIGFTGKNNMPLVTPTEHMSLTDKKANRGLVQIPGSKDSLRFGIRIGNGRYGFQEPVVVIGLSSPDQLDPGRIRENVTKMHQDVMGFSPQVIRAAGRVMQRFRYMTEPDYKKWANETYGAEKFNRAVPVLVGNWAYLDQERPYVTKRSKAGTSRTCTSSQVDALGQVVTAGYKDRPVDFDTDVPWMSPSGHAAVAAMMDGPRKPPNDDCRKTQALILAEQVREPGQQPAVVVGPDGTPLEKDARTAAMIQLAGVLGKNFDKDDEAAGPAKR